MEASSAPTSNGYSSILLVVGVLVILLLFYFASGYVMGSKTVTVARAGTTFGTYKKVTQLSPLGCPTGDDTRLCDYYVASSAYSTFPSSYSTDYTSDSIIPLVVKAGARLVEVNVYAENGKPVVGLQNEFGFNYSKNVVSFESCCVAITNSAFNKIDTPVGSDPFIFSIVFQTEDTNIPNACAEIIKTTMGKYLLGPEYSYHRKNLAVEPICNLMEKVVIVSGGNIKGTVMEELVNLSWSTSHLRRLTYMQASQPYDHEELINSNRRSITMVVPDPTPDLKNNNPTILFTYGCQWNLVNYGSLDTMMELYVEQFQQGSFIAKPSSLRYKPKKYKKPTLPDPSVSFQPMSHSSPIYDSNPKTGDKSIVI